MIRRLLAFLYADPDPCLGAAAECDVRSIGQLLNAIQAHVAEPGGHEDGGMRNRMRLRRYVAARGCCPGQFLLVRQAAGERIKRDWAAGRQPDLRALSAIPLSIHCPRVGA